MPALPRSAFSAKATFLVGPRRLILYLSCGQKFDHLDQGSRKGHEGAEPRGAYVLTQESSILRKQIHPTASWQCHRRRRCFCATGWRLHRTRMKLGPSHRKTRTHPCGLRIFGDGISSRSSNRMGLNGPPFRFSVELTRALARTLESIQRLQPISVCTPSLRSGRKWMPLISLKERY